MNVCTAVRNDATAIPPRIRLVDDRPPRPDRPSPYAMPTPLTAPMKAASGTVTANAVEGPNATAIVAPSPAPAAAPRRYGSASGFRNTAWYAAPEADSDAPTSPATITRGRRRSARIAACCSDIPDG